MQHCVKFCWKENLVTINDQSFTFVDNVEHLRSVSYLEEKDWLDLLQVSWKNYQQFRMGMKPLSDNSISSLGEFFGIQPQAIFTGNIDFKNLAISLEKNTVSLPEQYLESSYSRRRTTITSIEYIEKIFGWKLKQDILKHFGVRESALQDPYAKINVKFIIQICEYLRQRQFTDKDFFGMGAYSVIGNRNSLLEKTFRQMKSVQDVLYFLINDMTPLFEVNSTYKYVQLNANEGVMIMKSIPDIAHELGVKRLGSPEICLLKSGICASAPSYIGLPYAKVTHTTCEHRGDDACRFHIDTSSCIKM